MIYKLVYNHKVGCFKDSPVIFFDRDGTLIECEKGDYITDVSQVELFPGASDVFKRAKAITPFVFVVSNQRKVGDGELKAETLYQIEERMWQLIGAHPCASYYCCHRIEDNCDCRKPKIGLLREAMKLVRENMVGSRHKVLFGDGKVTDGGCAMNAGIQFQLVYGVYGLREAFDIWEAGWKTVFKGVPTL
jgi:histidinol-phosphate phosphatase family protein